MTLIYDDSNEDKTLKPFMGPVYSRPGGKERMRSVFNITHSADGYLHGNVVLGQKLAHVYCSPDDNTWYIAIEDREEEEMDNGQ